MSSLENSDTVTRINSGDFLSLASRGQEFHATSGALAAARTILDEALDQDLPRFREDLVTYILSDAGKLDNWTKAEPFETSLKELKDLTTRYMSPEHEDEDHTLLVQRVCHLRAHLTDWTEPRVDLNRPQLLSLKQLISRVDKSLDALSPGLKYEDLAGDKEWVHEGWNERRCNASYRGLPRHLAPLVNASLFTDTGVTAAVLEGWASAIHQMSEGSSGDVARVALAGARGFEEIALFMKSQGFQNLRQTGGEEDGSERGGGLRLVATPQPLALPETGSSVTDEIIEVEDVKTLD